MEYTDLVYRETGGTSNETAAIALGEHNDTKRILRASRLQQIIERLGISNLYCMVSLESCWMRADIYSRPSSVPYTRIASEENDQ